MTQLRYSDMSLSGGIVCSPDTVVFRWGIRVIGEGIEEQKVHYV